eukprot:CAMPEP_0171432788 /NCGR_PEP_ID=MMETSP0881-20121228/8107_1 /TAXON_ID=67004 /ORGANISM="Thalassiosira weissflogii, Strain CCMP1336" /LENGTH=76 /DNA_ID=CAMNT_0011953281 /DNA_START=137 /DNA_END=367 /DNA_ORIENTATION=+
MAGSHSSHPQTTASEEGAIRFSRIFDEQDHKRCTEGNKAALMVEKLERLRALKEEIARDDWMYTSGGNGNSNFSSN